MSIDMGKRIVALKTPISLLRPIHKRSQGGNMGNAWDTAKDGIMSEEDYPYEHKVFASYNSITIRLHLKLHTCSHIFIYYFHIHKYIL